MAPMRHNLTRRALLGVGVGVCVGDGMHIGHGPQAAPPDPSAIDRARWSRAVAAYRRAEARVAAFKAEEKLLPAERREWPAVRDLEERFGALDSLRLAVLRRLLRLPAPSLSALALNLELALADQAWELSGSEDCLAIIAADARRLSANRSL